MAYRAATRPDRWKAMIAALVTTGLLGAGIVSGLNVRFVSAAVQALKTFNVTVPEPPPPPPLLPRKIQSQPAKKPQGAPAKQAKPAPVVAPNSQIRLPSLNPTAAAPVARTGTASTAGASSAGSGTGAGGYGYGPGGGGTGLFTPARKVTKIPDSEYRRFAELGIPSGIAGVTIRVNPNGTPSDCRIARSSGNPSADSLMCQLTLAYVRFSPARDPSGRPIAQDVTFFPNWYRR